MRNQRRLRPVSRLPEGVSRTVGWRRQGQRQRQRQGQRERTIGSVRCLMWPHEYLCKTENELRIALAFSVFVSLADFRLVILFYSPPSAVSVCVRDV